MGVVTSSGGLVDAGALVGNCGRLGGGGRDGCDGACPFPF